MLFALLLLVSQPGLIAIGLKACSRWHAMLQIIHLCVEVNEDVEGLLMHLTECEGWLAPAYTARALPLPL